jgi:Tfp pilus assembly protein PilW
VRGLAPPRLQAAQAGISLVETLVALVLGLAMVSVAFNLYVSNRAVFGQIEAMVRLQESASIATALLEAEIRQVAGTLCRKNPVTTVLVRGPSTRSYDLHNPQDPQRYWEVSDFASGTSGAGLLGWHGYESTRTDAIVGADRIAGDSISIMSHNMGAVARVTASASYTSSDSGLTGSYTFPVDNGLNFPVGTVAMACDFTRTVLFQVTASTASTITLATTTATSPGNCAVTMRRSNAPGTPIVAGMTGVHNCSNGDNRARDGFMYTFGPGSMIAEHSFSHWYIGRKTNTTDGFSLYRRRMVYENADIRLGENEEMVPDVIDMKISIIRGVLDTGYPAQNSYTTLREFNGALGSTTARSVIALRILLTLRSPEAVGLAANNAASAATYTIPINVAFRDRMAGVVRR